MGHHRRKFQLGRQPPHSAVADIGTVIENEETVMFRFATPHTLGLFVVAGAASLWAVAGGPAAHAAPPASCQAPGAVSVQNGEAGATCSANSAAGGAAAAYGLDGRATADAAPTSLSLAVAQNGGTAASASQFLSGPAAIAVGPDAQTTVIGARPGLSIGIAGPGATVTVTGTSTPTCTGGPGFAGDFQTLQGCVSTG